MCWHFPNMDISFNQNLIMSSPIENRTPPDCILVNQFRHKGYSCKEIIEEDATILILTHDKLQLHAHEAAKPQTQLPSHFPAFFRVN
jgi:hypothetical protein